MLETAKIYIENFEKKNIQVNDVPIIINQLVRKYPPYDGWKIGEPEVISRHADGSIDISIMLKKYPMENLMGRSR